jgi:F-type H+-transporting ATPase subunit epsilon
MAKNLVRLKIITPHGTFFDDDVHIVTVKTTEGYIGLMKNHVPVVAAIVISELFINEKTSKYHREAAISGGLLYAEKTSVTIITDAVEFEENINTSRAELAKKRAEEALKTQKGKQEIMKNELALKRAINRIAISGK